MEAAVIQRQYDEVISLQYDQDPQNTTANSLERALDHILEHGLLNAGLPRLRVLDVGMGTGMFLERLRLRSERRIEPFGLDISARMAAIARSKLPDLTVAIDDGANLGRHFNDEQFDLAASHFVTGFVPLEKLAREIFDKLAPGGYWSYVGGTMGGYRELQRRAANPLLKLFFGGRTPTLQGMIAPADLAEVEHRLRAAGFEIVQSETWQPELRFPDFDTFIEYGYHGGWLTPFIEELGLHRAPRWQRTLLNLLVFPVTDHHSIAMAVARKPLQTAPAV
jgi:SAM-dependent methyltransferase